METGYLLHGLTLVSAQSLPIQASGQVLHAKDATIIIQAVPPWQRGGHALVCELIGTQHFADGVLSRSLERVRAGPESWLVLRFNMDLGLAFTEDGREVHIFGGLVEDLEYVAGVVAGPVASFLRWQRGWASLHASAVVVDGRVMAIGGQSGAGKSTTTAALALRGHPLFSDDVLGWRSESGRLLACPGPVRVKLWPDSLAAFDLNPESLPRVRTDLNKRLFQLPEAANDTELPLGAVYLLSTDMGASLGDIHELHGAEAFIALKANCRDDSVLTPAMRVRQFEALAELARCVPVRQVRAHPGLNRLTEFTDSLVADFRRVAA